MSAIDEAFIRAYQTEAQQSKRPNNPDQAWSGLAPTSRVAVRSRPTPDETPLEGAARQPAARRPLSDFARPAPVAHPQFKPALEVDHFRWSPVCEALVRQHADRL